MLEEENDMKYVQEEEAVLGRVTRGIVGRRGSDRLLQSRASWNVGQSRKQDWSGLVLIAGREREQGRAGQARPGVQA